MMHQSFGNIEDLDDKSLKASETLASKVYAGCNGSRACTYVGCMRTGPVWWIKSWRFVFELMNGS
jgi:hypothetical protein